MCKQIIIKKKSTCPVPLLLGATCQTTPKVHNERHTVNQRRLPSLSQSMQLSCIYVSAVPQKIFPRMFTDWSNKMLQKRLKRNSLTKRKIIYLSCSPRYYVFEFSRLRSVIFCESLDELSYTHYLCLSQCIWDWPRHFCKCADKDPRSGNVYQYQIALRKALSTEALNHSLKDLP